MRTFNISLLLLTVIIFSGCGSSEEAVKSLGLHPQNPHYFLFRGKPAVLIGSTEHYGAVMNLDFDYLVYLDELAASGLNVTRTFSGIYVEPQGVFNIEGNTLAPDYGRFISPWARSNENGYANGGNKFDLSAWDPLYFDRLKNFITEAGKRNIVVELDLFSNFYDTVQWKLSPLFYTNNVNKVVKVKDHMEILSLKHPELLEIQEKMVRKIVDELKDYDNLYYEICNEPYFGDTTALRLWEAHMTGIMVDAEKDLPNKHLISNNIANHHRAVREPREGVSVYNFHYARPPITVGMNYHLNKPIGDNETGFDGIHDATYRMEAWNFILAGGALFNHLDYSFTVGHEDGSFVFREGQPGGGGKNLRNQFRILAEFMKTLDYVKMMPVEGDFVRLKEESNKNLQGLTEDGKVTALYISGRDTIPCRTEIDINLHPGSYSISWIDTRTGGETVNGLSGHPGGRALIASPEYVQDIALKIVKTR